MMEVRVKLRPLQQKALEELDRRSFGVLICHRRFGKTVLAVARLCRNAAQGGASYRGAYIAPTYRQAKDVAWDYLKKIALAAGARVNESELRADFQNGARIRLYGAENPDALRGLNLCDVVFDEVAQMPYAMWSEIVLPMLLATHGKALFLGTPKGRNALWKVWENAKLREESWVALMYRASETGILSEEDLAVARRESSEAEYEQEYECSFTAAVVGAYYGKLMEDADKSGRICSVPYRPDFPVMTAWDLGFSDSTAIWFVQIVGQEVHVIDYCQASGVGLDHYVRELQKRGYVYGEHLFPHDAAASELGTGTTRLETLQRLGVRGRVLPMTRVEDGINAVRLLLPRCFFDAKKCAQGLEALRLYQREWDDKAGDFRARPLHDWTSHGADAFRYLAMGVENPAGRGAFHKLPPRKNLRVC
ncbi:terminase large subunit domain-containing protein [Mailhella massiliensis]|uniref:Terminase family protein n=1 Tax=Mailhella massiliensis TaxID=1903261 RepID=A0A921AW85_9BACT|nr:terminase family protein [Mailhella massiliensis]HJD97254.1 terminase family protein [Mailhella massiliensis]